MVNTSKHSVKCRDTHYQVEVSYHKITIMVLRIGCHIGSQLTEVAPFVAALDRVLELEKNVRIKALKKGQEDVVKTEKVDRINAEITNLSKALEDVNATLAAVRAGFLLVDTAKLDEMTQRLEPLAQHAVADEAVNVAVIKLLVVPFGANVAVTPVGIPDRKSVV